MKNTLIFLIINIAINSFSQDSLPYFKHNENGKYALFGLNGEALTNFKYEYVSDFKNNITRVAEIVEQGDCLDYYYNQGVINIKGEEIIKTIYDNIIILNDLKIILLEKGEEEGFSDLFGNIIAPIIYSDIGRLDNENELIKVEKEINGNYYDGYINLKGEIIIPCEYTLTDFSNGLTYGSQNKDPYKKSEYSGIGVLDSLGNIVIPMIYEDILGIKNGLFRVRKNKKYGYIDYNGKVVIPLEYVYAQHTASDNGLFLVTKNFNEGGFFINLNNEKVFTPIGYDDVHPFLENRAVVKKNKKYGFIDEKGELVVPLIYDAVTGFENQLARVELNNKIGFINSEGKVIIPIIYDEVNIHYFSEKCVKMKLKDNTYFFNVNGNKVTEGECNVIKIKK